MATVVVEGVPEGEVDAVVADLQRRFGIAAVSVVDGDESAPTESCTRACDEVRS